MSGERGVDVELVAAATRGARIDVDALRRALTGVHVADVEASVRWTPDGVARGNRVMIERASRGVLERVLEALECPPSPDALRLLAAAEPATVPLIAGWDVDHERTVAKLYVNASDSSEDARRALWSAAGWPEQVWSEVPHLLALNLDARGATTRKAYVQHADAARAAAELPADARDLALRVERAGLSAGAVVSWDLDGAEPSARAFFVALRDGAGGRVDPLLGALEGFSEAAVDAALPFARGHCRSVGVAASGPREWTAYFKPRGLGVPLWDLEPIAQFHASSAEVAVFVAPREYASSAYARTEAHAVSYRLTHGHAERREITALMSWIVERVCEAERARRAVDTCDPPAPWRRTA